MPVKINKKGFTLIELLVVIALIGILATFIVASFTSAQQKGRDARRKSDLDAIKKALELAKGDNAGGYYAGCVTTAPCTISIANNALIPGLVASSYIKALPADPSSTGATGSQNYVYTPVPTAVASGTATAYSLAACLENGNEATGGYITSVTSTTCGSSRQYVLTNP